MAQEMSDHDEPAALTGLQPMPAASSSERAARSRSPRRSLQVCTTYTEAAAARVRQLTKNQTQAMKDFLEEVDQLEAANSTHEEVAKESQVAMNSSLVAMSAMMQAQVVQLECIGHRLDDVNANLRGISDIIKRSHVSPGNNQRGCEVQ